MRQIAEVIVIDRRCDEPGPGAEQEKDEEIGGSRNGELRPQDAARTFTFASGGKKTHGNSTMIPRPCKAGRATPPRQLGFELCSPERPPRAYCGDAPKEVSRGKSGVAIVPGNPEESNSHQGRAGTP
jgi:hypothetical protein